MAPRRKRQRLDVDGNDKPSDIGEDSETLPHSKTQQRRQLFIRSLPANATTEDLTEYFSQSFPIKHAVAVTDSETKTCKGYGFVTFTDPEDAQRAKEEFDGSTLLGRQIKVEVAEPRHREGTGPGGKAEDGVKDDQMKAKKGHKPDDAVQPAPKLIVRNLPWSISTPEKLEALFRSYGKIKEAIVPKNDTGRMKGFGIVLIRGRKNAEKAIEGVNGKEVDGRTLAVDWAVDRETWETVRHQEAQPTDSEKIHGVVAEDSEKEDLDPLIHGDSDCDMTDGELQELSEQDPEDEDSLEDEDGDVDGTLEGSDVGEVGDEIKLDTTSPHRSTTNDATVFVRNLPFTCVDEDLEEHFSQFGDVRYARVVMDADSGRSRGTGFVCFRRLEDADSCLKESPRTQKLPSATDKKASSDKSAVRSVLQNEALDPSERYTMEGRVLQITRAVDKSEAARLTAEGVTHRNARDKDKRRLYLLHEGTIASNSPLYEKMTAAEKAIRQNSLKQRKSFVEKNPSLHLSLTRLAIRNIPRSITSKDLKSLAREAVVEFAKDVKAERRQPLSKEEVTRGGEEMTAAEKDRRTKGKGVVKQAKVVFEGGAGEKVDESMGAGRSRGYGFVEYHTHRNALMGLRWLNGHALDYKVQDATKKSKVSKEDIQDRRKRLIVEFALENAVVVQRRKEREVKFRDQPKDTQASGRNNIAKSRKRPGDKDPRAKTAGTSAPALEAKEKGADKSARRQQIIGRKRALRRDRRTRAAR